MHARYGIPPNASKGPPKSDCMAARVATRGRHSHQHEVASASASYFLPGSAMKPKPIRFRESESGANLSCFQPPDLS